MARSGRGRPPGRGPAIGPRRLAQAAFLLATLWGTFVVLGNAERWCPFGGVETAYAYLVEGNALCSVGVANFFAIGAVLLSVLLLRRAFCSHACPIGTLSEWAGAGARRLGLRPRRVPPALDRALSPLKYAVLALVLWFTWRAGELAFRGVCPAYALLGRDGADITAWAYVASGAILLGSAVVALPFCRWLCPLAAVMNPLSRVGLARVRRDAGTCAECGKCSAACPMGIPVEAVPEVTHARCTACGDCASVCPTKGRRSLALVLPGRRGRHLSPRAVAAALVLVLAAGVAAAALFPLPSFRWSRGDLAGGAAWLDVRVGDLSCRGRANLFVWFLDRDDDLKVEGALRVEAWPEPGTGRARIGYDGSRTGPDAIRAALSEPYFDAATGASRPSPFAVEGYDPLGLPPPGGR